MLRERAQTPGRAPLPKAGRWAIEIKCSLSARPEKGFYIACEDIAPKRAFVVYSGTDAHPLSHDVEATGVRERAQTLLALGPT